MERAHGGLQNARKLARLDYMQEANTDIAELRILDAAANRAREGLRVIEDFVRFALDDAFLTGELKSLRHELTLALAVIPWHGRLAARDTQADVGTAIDLPTERERVHISDLLAANFARLQEAVRTLEEFAKRIDAAVASRLERVRYQTYTLQKAVAITFAGINRWAGIHLYVLVDGRESLAQFEHFIGELLDAGVRAIQFRDKRLTDREQIERARCLRRLTLDRAIFIVNDRPDLAVLSRADGVHVGQHELSVKDVRAIVGSQRLVGVSTHSIEQARQAVLDGADYIGVGPVFQSHTKEFNHFPGVDFCRAVAAEIRLPAFAIGGIGPENLDQILAAGMNRVAVSGCITSASHPAEAARSLRFRLEPESPPSSAQHS